MGEGEGDGGSGGGSAYVYVCASVSVYTHADMYVCRRPRELMSLYARNFFFVIYFILSQSVQLCIFHILSPQKVFSW